ncbi:MAG: AEC family transporter [Candidatus Copromonas sp.]|nr:AEC family transporter [Candidatus Copromonas sp.]
MLIVFNQMVSLFLLMLTGYLANRSGVIDKTFESKVSRFIVNISLPATILNAVTGSDMAHDQEMLPIFVAAVSIFLVAHVICHFIQKTIRWNPTYELMLNYSNLGFMGIPIISTIYGGEYVLHVSIFMMTFNLSLFSYGVYLLSKDDAKKLPQLLFLKCRLPPQKTAVLRNPPGSTSKSFSPPESSPHSSPSAFIFSISASRSMRSACFLPLVSQQHRLR